MDKKYKLSFPQENILLVEKLNTRSSVNTITGTIKIDDIFNEEYCKLAINKLLKNNELLRIKIVDEVNDSYQIIQDFEYQEVEVLDLQNYSIEQINETLSKIGTQSINLESKLLIEPKILKYSDNCGAIVIKIHHIIADAWSLYEIATKLREYYIDALNKIESRDNFSESYFDYIESEKEYCNSEKYENDKMFWNEYLNNIGNPVNIKDKSIKTSNKAKRFSASLDSELNGCINNYCKSNGVSVYSLFLAAISTYIYRVRNEKDIILGTPLLNRSNFKEKNMLGMFISTLPIRIKIDENMKFMELVKMVSSNTKSIFKHQKYPYYKILENIHSTTNIKDNLFDIVLSFQNGKVKYQDQNFNIDWLFSGDIQNSLEIHILDPQSTGILKINYDYLVDLFSEVDIMYLHRRIISIIKTAINDENYNLNDINILDNLEEKMIYSINENNIDYPSDKSIVQLFEEQVAKNPNNIALKFQNTSMTYYELNKESNKLANFLKNKMGISRNDVVSIIINRGFNMIISILGILKAGASYLPIEPTFPKDRIDYIIKDSNTKIIICSDNVKLDYNNIPKINIDNYEFRNTEDNNINIVNDIEDSIYIMYTSGTTGKPKGVLITHKNITNLIFSVINHQNLYECNVWGNFSTYSFDIFILEAIVPLAIGKQVVILDETEQKTPKNMKECIIKNQIDVMNMTPTKFKLLLEYDKENNALIGLKRLMLGGEVFPTNYYDKIRKRTNAIIYNGYGPTETTVWCTSKILKDPNDINIGVPLPNIKAYILDDKNKILPLGITGELCIGGDGVGKGYHNREELTNQRFIDTEYGKLYRTGDLCYLNYNCDINYVGRKDSQVKIHGLRIEIEEIENVIKSFDGISQVAVIVNENQNLCVYFTSTQEIIIEDLKSYLKSKLPNYMVPTMYMKIDKFYITDIGKLDKKRLPKFELNIDYNKYIKPETKTELILEKNLKEILKVDKISIDKDLIELGLDSLGTIKLISLLNNMGIDITYQDIFNNSTIHRIGKLIDENKKVSHITKAIENKINAPITPAQKGIFINSSMTENKMLYNVPFEIKFSNKIDIEKLKKSIESAILKNKSLFTKFKIENDEIHQYLDYDKNYRVVEHNVTYDEYLHTKNIYDKSFEILEDRLFDFNIYTTERAIYAIANFHHIIFDGTSIYIFLNDIINSYNGSKINVDKCELIEDLNTEVSEIKYNTAKKYFLDEFSDELPVNSLPLDMPRSKFRSFNGDKVKLIVDEDIVEKLNIYSRNNKVTMNSIFLSLFNFTLSKYMYNEDIIIGIAADSRSSKRQFNSTGMYVSTLPFRTKINFEDKCLEYIKSIQNKLISTLDNISYSYDDLIKELNIPRDSARNPLFDVMFVYQNSGIPEVTLENETVEISPIYYNTSKFDLTCEILPNDNIIEINIEYCRDLFFRETIERFCENYLNSIRCIINNEKLLLEDIDIISDYEKNKILNEFNNSSVKYDDKLNIVEIFENQVKINPNSIAVVSENNSLTYTELNEKSNIVAHNLIKNGVKKGDMICIMVDKSLEVMVGILGILKAGAVYVPIEIDCPPSRIKYIIEDTKSKYILTSNKNKIDSSQCTLIDITIDKSEIFKDGNKHNLAISINSNDNAYVMYTSGTTGKPKGVIITHKNVVSLIQNTNYIKLEKDDRILQTGSLAFDATTFEYYSALFNSLPLYFMKKSNLLDLEKFEDFVIKNKITVIFLTTQLFNQIVEYNPLVFSNVRVILTGGEIHSIKHLNVVLQKCKNLNLSNVYGPTENTTFSTYYPIKDKVNKNVPIGKPIANKTCYIVDKCNKLCPINVPGELVVGGDGVANGYLNKPEVTKDKFIKNIFSNDGNILYRTGDLSRYYSDGNIDFIGRIDTQIKIRGFRIEPDEISHKMLENKNIKDAVIILEKIKNNKVLVAYYTSDEIIEEEYLSKELKKYFNNYMIPSYFIKVDKIPMNSNGKVNKSELNIIFKKYLIKRNKSKKNTSLSGIYLDIYKLFKETLKKDNIDINDNFFEIGGDSLNAINLVTKAISKNIKITYSDIFKYPSIKELGDKLNNIDIEDKNLTNEIKSLDYTKINNLLNGNEYNSPKIKVLKGLGNVLLTGVTGFLGAHVLDSFMKLEKGKIYCIIRERNNVNVYERLKSTLKFFFGNKYDNEIGNRIFVIEGDITQEQFVKDENEFEMIKSNIDTIINCAACVKHFGDVNLFKKINVDVVENLVNFSVNYKKRIIHISTLSVSGNLLEAGQLEQESLPPDTKYDEKMFYIGQNLDNVYAYTKFLGEKVVYDAIIDKKLDGMVMRMGNLTGRTNDGKFQPNVEENAFANRLKSMLSFKVIPDNILKLYLEFTPIDYASEAVILLSRVKCKYSVFHLFNHNHANMIFIDKVLNNMNINLEHISKNKMSEIIKEYSSNSKKSKELNGIILDINKNNELEYSTNIIVKSDFTINILHDLGFNWPTIDEEYVVKYLKYLFDVGFLKMED